MAHRNERLTPVTRAELIEQGLDGWPQAEVARLFRVSHATVAEWVWRFRKGGPIECLRPLYVGQLTLRNGYAPTGECR